MRTELPYPKPRRRRGQPYTPLEPWKVQHNKRQAQARNFIEHFFGIAKRRFAILRGPFRHDKKYFSVLVRFCCALLNIEKLTDNLNAATGMPEFDTINWQATSPEEMDEDEEEEEYVDMADLSANEDEDADLSEDNDIDDDDSVNPSAEDDAGASDSGEEENGGPGVPPEEHASEEERLVRRPRHRQPSGRLRDCYVF